jgi:hypothetical protein
MAERTIDADLFHAMAVHASAHRNIALAKKLIPPRDAPVTIFATIPRFEMRLVTICIVSPDPAFG